MRQKAKGKALSDLMGMVMGTGLLDKMPEKGEKSKKPAPKADDEGEDEPKGECDCDCDDCAECSSKKKPKAKATMISLTTLGASKLPPKDAPRPRGRPPKGN